VGTSFHLEDVKNIKFGDRLEFKHTPIKVGDKEYPNAISIWVYQNQVGHLPESSLKNSPQQQVLAFIKAGHPVFGNVTEVITPKEEDKFKDTFKFDIDLDENIVLMESFNEGVVVEFDKEDHVYTYGKETLLSPSTYANDDSFKRDEVAGYCAKAWDMQAGDVIEMWKSTGNISAGMGSQIHNCLEHYTTFSKLLPADKKDKAMPKHIILKNIINGYLDLDLEGEVIPEVFLTYISSGLAGQLDELRIIDAEKKICDVADFKINVESKKKVKKYADQLFLYAHMLIQTGWIVRNVYVLAYEEEWIIHDLNPYREECLQKIKETL